jgi:hypothetical protein
MSVAHRYPSQIQSRGRHASPLIARARARAFAGYASIGAGLVIALALVRPADVNARSEAPQPAALRAAIEPAPPPVARNPVRVIPIVKPD